MLVRFLKSHVTWKVGDEANIDDSMSAYMLLCGVVEPSGIDNSKTEEILLNHLEENRPDKNTLADVIGIKINESGFNKQPDKKTTIIKKTKAKK